MIFVECYSDTRLVKTLANLPSEYIIHEAVGKSGVCNQLNRSSKNKGLIDEDPQSAKHPYERRGQLQGNYSELDIRHLHYTEQKNDLIILCPKLEDWFLKSASICHIDVTQHGLPNDPNELHRIIDQKLPEFTTLLHMLVKQKSERVITLQNLLR